MLLFTIFISILFCQPASGENTTYIPVPLDGFNTILFDLEYPHKSLNMYSLVYGNPLDNFPFDQFSYFSKIYLSDIDSINTFGKDSPFRLQASAKAGSESGEPMFNALEGSSGANRDHFTSFATACNIPKTPFNLFFSYRYTDNYSDRFDGMWVNYTKVTGKHMKYDDVGLAHEISGGYTLKGSVVSTGLKVINYKHWGTTPYYFSPMYSNGYALYPALLFKLPNSTLHADFLFDYHKDYFNHTDFIDYTDEGWDVTWQRTLKKGVTAQLGHHKNSRIKPASYANATLHDTVSNLFVINLCGNLFSNLRMGGALDFNYIQFPNFLLNVNSSWDYTPKTRDYYFYENKTRVEYYYLEYESSNLHTALTYTDTIAPPKTAHVQFPIKASIWMNYCGNPLWETVEYAGDTVIIRQDTISNAAHVTMGGKGSYKISLFNKLFINLWGNAALLPKNRELRFSMPLNLGADIEFGKPDNDSLFAAIKIENRDRTSLKYRKENNKKILEYIGPEQTGVSLLVKIPFYPPFFRNHVRTNVQIEAGPIRFSKKQRIKMHPLGNPIGPAISLELNGFIN